MQPCNNFLYSKPSSSNEEEGDRDTLDTLSYLQVPAAPNPGGYLSAIPPRWRTGALNPRNPRWSGNLDPPPVPPTPRPTATSAWHHSRRSTASYVSRLALRINESFSTCGRAVRREQRKGKDWNEEKMSQRTVVVVLVMSAKSTLIGRRPRNITGKGGGRSKKKRIKKKSGL